MSNIKERGERIPTEAELLLAILAEKKQFNEFTPAQKIATLIHAHRCKGDHCILGANWNWLCNWYATDWNNGGSTRELYLRKAEKLIELVGDPQKVIEVIEILLGKANF
jgi:hypothetical protein